MNYRKTEPRATRFCCEKWIKNGFNYFVCGHSPDYETKSKEENEIVRAAFEQYCRAHDYMMDAAQKRFMESLKVAA